MDSNIIPLEQLDVTIPNNQDVIAKFRDALSSGHSEIIIDHIRALTFDFTQIIDATEGETLLMLACRYGRKEIVEEMMKLETFHWLCKKTNKDRKTSLTISAEMGHASVVRIIVEYLVERKDDVIIDLRDSGGFTALMWACYKGLFAAADVLIRIGKANVNIRADNHMTCLMWAAGRGHEEVCKILLQNGASANVTDKFGSTAFFWACRHNRISVARYLLQHGANPDIAGLNGKTPLMLAAKSGNFELVSIILSTSNANVNMIDGDGCTPLMLAAKEGHLEVVTALIQAGASVNICDKKTDSVLIYAVRAGRLEVVRKLCEGRIDINHQGQDSKTALYCAVEKLYQDIVALLLSYRADVELSAGDKSTPLLKAVKLKNAAIVDMLLNSNAKLSPTDKNGDTVLHIALRQRSRKIVQLLLRNPRNARLLYKPNKHNITPYSIDESQDQPILPQLFGTTNLNRPEHSQSLVGYELYSSSLAVMLSEPTLCTPLTVGLYARWGSGKSFVVSQLKDYLSQYALQEGIVLFRFSPLVIFLCGVIAALVGLVSTLSLSRDLWFIGVIVSLSVLLSLTLTLLALWWFSRHRAPKWVVRLSQKLESFMRTLSIVTNVVFANPVATTQYLQQLRFIVVNCPKFSGNVRPGGIIRAVLAEMYLQVEAAYGSLTSRLLLIFTPNDHTHRAYRQFCCLPLYIWAVIWGVVFYVDCILIYAYWPPFATWRGVEGAHDDTTASVFIIIFSSFSLFGVLLFFFGVVCRFCYLSVRPPYQQLLTSETHSSVLTEEALGRLVKHHTNLLAKCVQAIDNFACTQTRFLVILDELDTYDQANVVHMLDVVHRYFASESRAPFINVLVLDPHIIIKHLDAHLASSNYEGVQMTGHDYLRSVVHLPIFLQAQPSITIRQLSPVDQAISQPNEQSAGVKQRYIVRQKQNSTKQSDTISIKSVVSVTTNRQARNSTVANPDDTYILSMQSIAPQMNAGKGSGLSELIGSMSAEYFSDVNPRTLTRVTNICAFMARLLHASSVPFNWYNLTAWVNLTEQWPYHLSWILVYIENNASAAANYDLRTPIATVYFSVKRLVPPNDVMRFMDKSPLKLEAALNSSNPTLTLNDVLTFLRFTVNLDPYLRRIVRDHAHQSRVLLHNTHQHPQHQPLQSSPSRQVSVVPTSTLQQQQPAPLRPNVLKVVKSSKPLAAMTVEDVCDFMSKIPHLSQTNIDRYKEALIGNNICGPVLALCNMEELRKAIPMTFGDWQLFVTTVGFLRASDAETSGAPAVGNTTGSLASVSGSLTSGGNPTSIARQPCDQAIVCNKELVIPKGAALTLTVPSSIAEVNDSYGTPDSAADVKTPMPSFDGDVSVDIYAEQARTHHPMDDVQPPISSSFFGGLQRHAVFPNYLAATATPPLLRRPPSLYRRLTLQRLAGATTENGPVGKCQTFSDYGTATKEEEQQMMMMATAAATKGQSLAPRACSSSPVSFAACSGLLGSSPKASASAIQSIEASLLRRAVSGMLFEEEPNDDDQPLGDKAEFMLGDDAAANVAGQPTSAGSNDIESARSAFTVPNSPTTSESSLYHVPRRGVDGSPSPARGVMTFRVTKSALSPVPSANVIKHTRATSENSDDSSSIDGRVLKLEQQPLLSE